MQAIIKTLALLDTLDGWIDDIPPQETPQRFGNLAFRTWGKRLEEVGQFKKSTTFISDIHLQQTDTLLKDLLPPDFAQAIPLVKPYFLTSFGSFLRMDYGTGHETSFALFLLCLTLIRYFRPIVEEERGLVLLVFVRYMRLCWKLQDVYKLEPAGSHGVWGLDDSSMLGYIFGSGQLRGLVFHLSYRRQFLRRNAIDQSNIPVSAVLRPPLPPTNLYFMSIMRIHDVKHGPFHEHSSQLHSIAVGVPNWAKVNSGLFKMYEVSRCRVLPNSKAIEEQESQAEVLGKRVVVQHIPLGGLLEWNIGTPVPEVPNSWPSADTGATTQAPWASSNRSMGAQYGRSNPSFKTDFIPRYPTSVTPRRRSPDDNAAESAQTPSGPPS